MLHSFSGVYKCKHPLNSVVALLDSKKRHVLGNQGTCVWQGLQEATSTVATEAAGILPYS